MIGSCTGFEVRGLLLLLSPWLFIANSSYCVWHGAAPNWKCECVRVELYTEFVVTASGVTLLQVGGEKCGVEHWV